MLTILYFFWDGFGGSIPSPAGRLEYTVPDARPKYTVESARTKYTVPDARTKFTVTE